MRMYIVSWLLVVDCAVPPGLVGSEDSRCTRVGCMWMDWLHGVGLCVFEKYTYAARDLTYKNIPCTVLSGIALKSDIIG